MKNFGFLQFILCGRVCLWGRFLAPRFWLHSLCAFALLAALGGCATVSGPEPESAKRQLAGQTMQQLALVSNSAATSGPWGAINFLSHPIVFASKDEKFAILFFKGSHVNVPYAAWEKQLESAQGGYAFINAEGGPYLLLNLDGGWSTNAENLTRTIFHEGFHLFVQSKGKGWNLKTSDQGRGDFYPVQSEPRYYRWEMGESLKTYVQSKDPLALRSYKYWYLKWKNGAPKEYTNFTDLVEGTAEYFANAQMTKLRNLYLTKKTTAYENFQKDVIDQSDPVDVLSLTFESYLLGALAGMGLDQRRSYKWREKVAQGASPLKLLAKGVQPLTQQVRYKMQSRFFKSALLKMQTVDHSGKMDEVIRTLAGTKGVRVVLPHKALTFSTFKTNGMYRPAFRFVGMQSIQMTSLTSELLIKWGEESSIKIPTGGLWVSAGVTPCGDGGGTLFMSSADKAVFSDNVLEFSGGPLFNVPARKIVKNGTTWYCAFTDQ